MSVRVRAIAAVGILSAALVSVTAWGDAPPPAAREPGVWQKHEYSFAFMGFTSTYSCDGLASKLKILLIAAGARPDAKSEPGACAAPFGRPDKFARADLKFYSLAPAASAGATDGAPVDGSWIPVTMTDHQPRDLGRGDCELVEQFRTNVLPMFATRQVDNHTTCIPHQESGSVIDLKFESFRLPPKPAPDTPAKNPTHS
jgi:hypothetical protein